MRRSTPKTSPIPTAMSAKTAPGPTASIRFWTWITTARYAATMRSVSSASAGVRVMRISPFVMTYVRSARATVRCARCSTSSTVTPRSRIFSSASKTTSTIVGARPSEGSSRSRTDGPGDERARDRELLLLAAREHACRPRPVLRHDREQLLDPPAVLLDAVAAVAADEPEAQVLLDRQLGEDPAAFRDERDARPRDRLRLPADDRRAGEANVAGSGPDQARDRVQRRRLAGPVRADQADDLPFAHGQVELPHGRHRAVVDREVVQLERGGSAHPGPSWTALSPR